MAGFIRNPLTTSGFLDTSLGYKPYGYSNNNFEGLFNYAPIPVGSSTINYVDFSDYEVPEYVAPVEETVPVYVDTGGDGDSGGGPGRGGHGGHSGGNAADGSEADTGGGYGALGHSDGGAIPPMYANQGMLMDDKEIGGFINEGLNYISNKTTAAANQPAKVAAKTALGQALSAASNPVLGTAATAIADSLMAGMSNQQVIDKVNPFMDAQLYDAIYDFSDYSPAQNALPGHVAVQTGINPLADEYASVGDYGIDDTNPTMGAIPGDYSPPVANITVVSNPMPTTFSPEVTKSTPATNFKADLEAAIEEISNEIENNNNSVSGPSGDGGYGNNDDGMGGGSGGGGFGDGDSDSGSGTDGANSGGGGIGGGNDSFRSMGGRIYASQGGYVNSVGGK